MKNNINEFIRLDMTEEKISELQNISMEISKLKSKESKDRKKHNRLSRDCVTTKGGNSTCNGKKYQKEKKKRKKQKKYLKW